MLVSHKTIGRNIRTARKRMGYTQEQTAEKLKISLLHYGRLERGERPASLEQIATVAMILGVSIASLLTGCANGETFGIEPRQETKTLGDAVVRIADGCSAPAQELMLALCQTVAAQDKRTDGKRT